jgi:tRNA (guanine26-N2/guanine27-N2)-dimethyltransferase
VKLGGLVYVTNTDGRGSAGKAPAKALAAYGTWATHHSAVNEQGLRMLVSCCLEWSEGVE